jgi:positive regulator of sigma E activity
MFAKAKPSTTQFKARSNVGSYLKVGDRVRCHIEPLGVLKAAVMVFLLPVLALLGILALFKLGFFSENNYFDLFCSFFLWLFAIIVFFFVLRNKTYYVIDSVEGRM